MDEKQYAIIFLSLLVLSLITIILSRKSFNIAKQERNIYRNHPAQYRNNHRNNHLPNKFSEDSIIEAAKYYGRKNNYALAFDTNILIEHPDILEKIAKASQIPLLISQQVRYELDHLKDRDESLSQPARIALKHISNLHKEQRIKIVYYNKEFMRERGFNPDVADDRVICSYLERAETNENIVFVTDDNNARTTARTTKLIPLELDWDGQGRKRKPKQFRPGYFHTVLGIALISLAFGFFNGAMNVVPGKHLILDNFEGKVKSSSTKEEATPINYDEFTFEVESEFGDKFFGKDFGEWGKLAIVDMKYLNASGVRRPRVQFVFASNSDVDISKKENEITYILERSDGEELEPDVIIFKEYENGVEMRSIDSIVKFSNINSYETIQFTLINSLQDKDYSYFLDNAKIHVFHKVTGEEIGTFPAQIIQK